MLNRTIRAAVASGMSQEQLQYAAAKAMFETCRERCSRNQGELNAEAARLGPSEWHEGTAPPYACLKDESHVLMVQAQELLNAETVARDAMYAAAFRLFDWGTENVLARMGTDAQKSAIRAMVVTVKGMAFVERPFEEFVDICMRARL